MNTQSSAERGQLYVVATPIGNLDDLTFRAAAVLRSVDVIICEERKQTLELLRYYDIEKDLIELNEHNDAEATIECVKLLATGKKLALVSDAGTPLVADPGDLLVQAALRYGYPVHVVPGPSSILTALVRSGLPTEQFLYAGFLSRKKEQRLRQIQLLALEPRTLVLLDTPYRLHTVIDALASVMPQRRAYIGCNLTMENESHHYGTLAELAEHFATHRFRGEYVIVIEGNPDARQWYARLNEEIAAVMHNGAPPTLMEEQSAQQSNEGEGQSDIVQQPPPNDKTYHRKHGPRHLHHRRYRDYRELNSHRHRKREENRYDHQQPIVNYTLSNPYQQAPSHRSEQHSSVPYRRPRKRWRR